MKQIEIKVPATIADCSPQQLSKWLFLCSGDVKLESLIDQLDFRVQVVSIFSGLSKERLYNTSSIQIHEPFNHIIDLLNYEPIEPNGTVEFEGKRYVFDKTFENKTTGQIIDMKLIEDIYSDPIQVMSILYVEEGMIYNQVDEHDRVLNPLRDREKIFAEHFRGDEFLNVFAFFLSSYEKLRTAIFTLNTAKAMSQMDQSQKELMREINSIQRGTNGQAT